MSYLTNGTYSPWDRLPAPEPRTVSPPYGEFYHTTSKHFIKDIVRIMDNGIPIDMSKVEALDKRLQEILQDVDNRVQNNPLIKKFQLLQHKHLKLEYVAEQRLKLRTFRHYLKDFVLSKMDHRSYFMAEIAKEVDLTIPEDLLPTGIPKWTVRACKLQQAAHPAIRLLVEKKILPNNIYAKRAMLALAKDKAEIFNRSYRHKIDTVDQLEIPPFNVASSLQKRKLFEYLDIASEAISKDTGLAKWDRDQIERVYKETADPDVKAFTLAFIDHSFGAIVKNNFIKAFYNYSIDGVLYAGLTVFGTKTYRLTSQNPNMLNSPSSRSIYSKPIKECFVAPPGKMVMAVDYGAIESRVISSLSMDPNLTKLYTDGLDGHTMNSIYYFREEIAEHMKLTGDLVTDVKEMYRLVEEGNKPLKGIRQKSKQISFGLQYGCYPPKIQAAMKCSMEEAQTIFDRYHNELYPGVTKFREEYVVPTAKTEGRVHMGLGCYMHTDNPRRDVRTLTNACSQFWSLLTLMTINKLHQLIDEKGVAEHIQIISTIYDSIYFIIDEDPLAIEWLNNRLIPTMTKDFMLDQTVKNEATAEIGYDWYSLKQIPNNATEDEIVTVMDSLQRPD